MQNMQNIALFGATGSIGESTLDVIAQYPDRYRVQALVAGSNYERLAQLTSVWRPAVVAIASKKAYQPLVDRLRDMGVTQVQVLYGEKAIEQIAAREDVGVVVQAIVGAAGVRPSFAAAKAGKKILLVNKESLVCGGTALMRLARENGAVMLPVDSEHNAVFQCLHSAGTNGKETAHLWLTCSGGPFHAHPEIDLSAVTPEQALAHPTWKMGRKISVDSATLMNKGLEVIEAHHLFDVPPERISAVIHPQSVVHSMVEFVDGSVLAQLASADMKLPIAYCLAYPERIDADVKKLKLTELSALTFAEPDTARFPQLAYAYEALRIGGTASIALNGANEVAVAAFLAGRIGFTDIARTCRAMLDKEKGGEAPETADEVVEADKAVRAGAEAFIAKIAR